MQGMLRRDPRAKLVMSVIDQIKERLDIVDLIGRHVHLQKSGRYLKGLCPFHTEKTPSFFVFPDTQRWHCFGCNRGGDIFTFIMELEGLDFRSALEELARQANVPLVKRTPQQVQAENEAERLRSLIASAVEYYHTLLMTAPQARQARDYLKRRGFKRETVELFQLGYSLDTWDALRTHLLGLGYSVEEQIKAGLLIEREGGGTYDRFRGRVMIPIYDRRGRPIAFGSRALGDEQPKYMNSPQTPLFDKSKVLFGLHLASRGIRETDAAVIVEGYMDVMIPYQAGYRNIVAPMGTALTEAHLKQLQRLTRRFILALDPDSAGIHGTLQGLETARQVLDRDWVPVFDARGLVGYEGRLKAEIRVATLPDGLDPDEIVLQDPQRWESIVEQSQPVVRFVFRQLLSQGNPDEPKTKSRIVDTMLPLLRDIQDSIERDAYAQEIATTLGLDPRTLLDRLRATERAAAIRVEAAIRERQRTPTGSDLEAYLLTILLHHPDLLKTVDKRLTSLGLRPIDEHDFSTGYQMIWHAWHQLLEQPECELDELLPPDMIETMQGLSCEALPELSLSQWQRDVVRTVLRLRERKLRESIQEAQMALTTAQSEGQASVQPEISARIQQLSRELRMVQVALAQR